MSSVVNATGRRKSSRVMVSLKKNNESSNEILVYGRKLESHFDSDPNAKESLFKTFTAIEKIGFTVNLKPKGGGKSAQLDAAILGISRALVKYFGEDESTESESGGVKSILKSLGFLTRDDRKKERQKPGLRGARARGQWSKR